MTLESKRFALSKEPFAKERVQGIKRAFEAVQSERPEVLSFALFGSTVKGTVREDSDIDAYVYVDADRLGIPKEQSLIPTKWDYNIERSGKTYDASFRYAKLRPDLATEYEQFVRQKLQEELPTLTPKQTRDVKVFPMDYDTLATMTSDLIQSYEQYPKGATSQTIFFRSEPLSGAHALRDTPGARVEPNHVLYSMFFLSKGLGLKPYRAFLIDALLAAGETGERVWEDLIASTEGWEQKIEWSELPNDKRYPRTLAEAKKVYG